MKFIDKLLGRTRLSSNRRKVLRNVYWAVTGKVVGIANQLLVGIMVARYLGPEQFGLMNYVLSYVMLFSVFATFGLDGIEIRELSKSNADKNTIIGTAFILRMSFALATILLVFLTLLAFESDSYTFVMVMVFSLSLVASAFNVIRNYFTSIILNEYVVKSEISRTCIGALIRVVLLLCHCSLTWFIVASTFDFILVAGGYLYSYQKKAGRIREWKFCSPVAGMLVRASFPLLLSGAAIIVYQKINAVMIRNMIDNAAVGQFSVAAKVVELGAFVPMMVAQTVTPLLVKAHQEDEARYLAKRQQFMDVMVWSSIGIAVAIFLLAAPTISVLYGAGYVAAIPALKVMAWRPVFTILSYASGTLLLVENCQRYVAVRNLLGCVASVLFNLLLIPVWGVVGSAMASLITMVVSGYIAHMIIKPYRYLVSLQTNAILWGWRRVLFSHTLVDLISRKN
jgi:O-antigen/teichoic acid export membrane protein